MAGPAFRRRISALADLALSGLLTGSAEKVRGAGHRQLMGMVKTAVACYLDEQSRWHGSAAALVSVPLWLAELRRLQGEDGLFSSLDNLASPPDSSFTVNDMAAVHHLVCAPAAVGDAALRGVQVGLEQMMALITPALVAGGVHTPNHRWEIASALARLDAWTPNATVRKRIEDWLAEGIDVAPDGLYSERSPNYAAHVTNPSLIVLADHLRRPELLEIVHRNLHAQAVLTDGDGLVETVHSRRQDQGRAFRSAPFAIQYRRFALLHGCAECASAAVLAEPYIRDEAVGVLAELLAHPALGDPMPVTDLLADDPPVASTPGRPTDLPNRHSFPSAALVRVDQGRSVVTIYGGSDVTGAGRIASGLACDPTFLRWRSGRVMLDSVRLSRNFFGLGPFRSVGLESREPAALSHSAREYRLQERVSAAYYQPLRADLRRDDGGYRLEHEGRFSAAMAFSERDRTEVELETELTVTSGVDFVNVDARFSGAETSYAFELCFRLGGVLEGVQPLAATDCYELVEGLGSYRVDEDVVSFGPGHGSGPDQPPGYDPGEAYTFLSGTDAASGVRVYVTGRTPGRHRLILRAGTVPQGRTVLG